MLSIQKSLVAKLLPRFFISKYQRSCLFSTLNQVSARNFPADDRWFDQAEQIISNQFASLLKSSSNSADPNGLVHQTIRNELLSAVSIMQERIGCKKDETILNIERKCQTGIGLNHFFQATSTLLMSCIDHDKLLQLGRPRSTLLHHPGLNANIVLQLPIEYSSILQNLLTRWIVSSDVNQILDSPKPEPTDIVFAKQQQLTLAKVTEMIYFATALHSQISELKSQSDNLANKMLTTLSDYILTQIVHQLADFKQPVLNSLLVSILQYKSKDVFFKDFSNIAIKSTFQKWIQNNRNNFVLLLSSSFQSVFQVTKIKGNLIPETASGFGRQLGLAIKTFQDINNLNVQMDRKLFDNLRALQRAHCSVALIRLEQLPLNDDAKECFRQLLHNCTHI